MQKLIFLIFFFVYTSLSFSQINSGGLVFDAAGKRVTVPTLATYDVGSGDFTIEFWLKFSSVQYGNGRFWLFDLYNNSTGHGSIVIYDGVNRRLNFQEYLTYVQSNQVTSLFDNQCHHIAVTRIGTTIRFYLDGTFLGGFFFGTFTQNSASPISFGHYSGSLGFMHEVRYWNIARTQAAIQSTMNSMLTGTETGLIGYWKCNEGSGQVINDFSPTNNDGFLGTTTSADVNDPAFGPGCTNCPAMSATVTATGPTTVCYTDSVLLSASSAGSTTYQWMKNGSRITGATAITYYARTTGSYQCVAGNSCGNTLSNAIPVTVLSPSGNLVAGGPTTFCTGGSVTLTADTGTGYSYRWRKDGVDIPGATAISYSATTTGSYTVAVTLSGCTRVSSAIAVTVQASAPPASITAGGSTTFCSGGNVTLSANTGTGLTYQWNKNATAIPSATGATYSAASGGSYTCDVGNTCGFITSNAIAVTVNNAPSITQQPVNAFVCSGANTSFTIAASGAGLSYQWKENGTSLTNGGVYSGVTSSVLILTGVPANFDLKQYSCTVTGSCNPSITSNAATLSVGNSAGPAIAISGPASVCSGATATYLALPQNAGLNPTYQWKVNGINVGTNSLTYFTSTLTNGSVVTCTLTTNDACSQASAASNPITVTLLQLPVASISAGGSTTFCSNSSVTLSATTGTGWTYQWQLNGTNISGATSSSRSVNQAGNYTCVVTNACGSVVSNSIPVTVNLNPSAAITSGGATTFCNDSQQVTLTATAGAGYTYQWYKNNFGSNQIINGATSQIYLPPVNQNSGYLVKITSSQGCATNSNAVTVAYFTSLPPVQTVFVLNNQTWLCPGVNYGPHLYFSKEIGVNYQWRLNGTPITSNCSGSSSICIGPNTPGVYSCDVTNTCGTSSSNGVTITQAPVPVLAVTNGNPNSCSGTVFLQITNAGQMPAGTTYQWTKNGVNIRFETNTNYLASNAGDYTCVVSVPGCTAPVPAAIRIYATPNVTATATQFCTSSTLTASPAGSTYQWRLNGVDIPGATAGTYNATASGNFSCLVTNATCGAAATASLALTAGVATPIYITATGNIETSIGSGVFDYCNSNNVLFAEPANLGTYTWYIAKDDGFGSRTDRLIYSGTSNILPTGMVPGNTYMATGTYKVSLNNGCAISNSTDARVRSTVFGSVHKIYKNDGSGTTYCSNANIPYLTVRSFIRTNNWPFGTDSLLLPQPYSLWNTYQWTRDGVDIPGATAYEYHPSQSGFYNCRVSNSCGTANTYDGFTGVEGMDITIRPVPDMTVTASGPLALCPGQTITLSIPPHPYAQYYYWYRNGSSWNSGSNMNSLTVTSAGTYYVRLYTGLCGDFYSTNQVVTAATSTITAGGPTSFCNGSVLLSANTGAGLTYQWIRNSINIPGATLSTYTATLTGTYTCSVSNGTCTTTSNFISVNQYDAVPVATIVADADTTICPGGSVSLHSFISLGTGFQWLRDGIIIPGATQVGYIATVAGSYTCNVTNPCGTSLSNAITVAVTSATPASVTASGSLAICPGSTVTLNANSGAGLSYQWKKNGTAIPGATTSSLAAGSIGSYTCIVTLNGCSSESNALTVTYAGLVTITLQPGSADGMDALIGSLSSQANTNYGNTGELNAMAWTVSGSPALQRSLIRFDLSSIPANAFLQSAVLNLYNDPNSSNPTPPGSHSGSNSAVIQQVTSAWNENTVTWNTQPTTTTSGQVILPASTDGHQDYAVDVTSLAQDMVANPSTNYGFRLMLQIETTQRALIFGSSDNIDPANRPALTISYTVLPTAAITAAGPTTFCSGGSVLLNANTGAGLTYQWKKDGLPVSGATASSYTSIAAGNFTCEVSNGICSAVSNAISVSVDPAPAASISAGGPVNFCAGGSVTLNANTGTGLSYQWKLGVNTISGATLSSYSATAGGNYSCVVTNSCGSTTSNTISVIVDPLPPAVISASGPTSFCNGRMVALNANTGAGLTYQWQANGVNINGATSDTYGAFAGATYTCVVTNACGSSTSNSIAVTIIPPPSANITAHGSTSFCAGSNVKLESDTAPGVRYQWMKNNVVLPAETLYIYTATTPGDYTCEVSNPCDTLVSNAITVTIIPAPSADIFTNDPASFCQGSSAKLNLNTDNGTNFQWQLNGVNITGATALDYTAGTAGNYTCLVTGPCGSTVSNIITLSVIPSATASITAGGPTSFCPGGSVTLNANTGAGLTYQWKLGTNNIAGATASSYNASAAGSYTCVVSNLCGGNTSNAITVTISALPTANITAGGSTSLCTGGSVTLNANTGTGLTYQWKLNTNNITGATAASYNATAAGSYTCVVSNACGGTSSNSISVTVNSSPTATITAAGSTSICQGSSVTLNANTGTGLTYQWKLGSNNITGATASSYNATAAGSYTCVVSNTCGGTTSNAIAVTINPLPAATITAAGSTAICTGGSVTLNANTGAGLTYQWKLGGSTITGATSSSYTATATGSYTCAVSNTCGTTTSNTITVTSGTAPATPSNISGNNKACPSTTEIYSVTAVSGMTYNWTAPAAGTVISGQGTNTVTVSYASNFTSGTLSVTASNGCGTSAARTKSISKNNRCGAAPATVNHTIDRMLDAVIYPNPSPDHFTLRVLSDDLSTCKLIVHDLTGRVVEYMESVSPGVSVEFGKQFSGGVYLVEIIQGEERKVLRVVKTQ